MRLSAAALAAEEHRTANAAKLTLRIIAASLVKQCWKPRQPGGEDNEADRVHRSALPGSAREPARAWSAVPTQEPSADGLTSTLRDSRPCYGRDRKQLRLWRRPLLKLD